MFVVNVVMPVIKSILVNHVTGVLDKLIEHRQISLMASDVHIVFFSQFLQPFGDFFAYSK